MDSPEVIDLYFRAGRKRDALRRMVDCDDPVRVEQLQEYAVRRYARNTLTLTELKQLAFDLAAICPAGPGQDLYLALADSRQCCVRAANIEARKKLEKWLAG